MSSDNDKRGPWKIISKQDRDANRWIRVTHHEVITPSRDEGIYCTVHRKNRAIGIVAVDAAEHSVHRLALTYMKCMPTCTEAAGARYFEGPRLEGMPE